MPKYFITSKLFPSGLNLLFLVRQVLLTMRLYDPSRLLSVPSHLRCSPHVHIPRFQIFVYIVYPCFGRLPLSFCLRCCNTALKLAVGSRPFFSRAQTIHTVSCIDTLIQLTRSFTYGGSYVVSFHISMPAGFRRHLVGKTLRNVC